MTKNKKLVLFSFFVIFIILASVNSISAAPGGSKYYVNGYVKAVGGAPISGAKVKLYLDGSYINTVYTNYQGYFSGSTYTTGRPRLWKAVVTKDGYVTETKFGRVLFEDPTSMGTIYLMPLTPSEERISVFFWASDVPTQAVIDEYKAVLQNEGYTKFFDFKDSTNFAADFATVAAYEDAEDIIFFYIAGHGAVDDGHSYTDIRGLSGDTMVYSDVFRTYCDSLDSTKVGLLVESCHSGYWPVDMEGGDYLAISSCDHNEVSYAMGTFPCESYFSDSFFDYVSYGYSAVPAYDIAKALVLDFTINAPDGPQNAQICDESSHTFFDW